MTYKKISGRVSRLESKPFSLSWLASLSRASFNWDTFISNSSIEYLSFTIISLLKWDLIVFTKSKKCFYLVPGKQRRQIKLEEKFPLHGSQCQKCKDRKEAKTDEPLSEKEDTSDTDEESVVRPPTNQKFYTIKNPFLLSLEERKPRVAEIICRRRSVSPKSCLGDFFHCSVDRMLDSWISLISAKSCSSRIKKKIELSLSPQRSFRTPESCKPPKP